MAVKISTRNLRYLAHRILRRKTTILDGLQLTCDRRLVNRAVVREIIKGAYEEHERELVRRAVRPGDLVLEIGAGVGVVGLLCTRMAGAGRVTSYEANPTLESVIRTNFALNGVEPKLILKAVTVDGGPISFFRNDNILSSSIYDRKLASEKITVDSIPIDQAIRESEAQVIVMDVEGAEIDLLPVADLSGIREIIVEVHPHIVGADALEQMAQQVCAKGFVRRAKRHKTEWFSRSGEAKGKAR